MGTKTKRGSPTCPMEVSAELLGQSDDDALRATQTAEAWFTGLLPRGTPGMYMNLSVGVQGTITRGLRAPDSDTHLAIDTLVDRDGAVRTNTFRANMSPQTFGFGLGW